MQIGRARKNRQIHNAHKCFFSPALVSTSNLHEPQSINNHFDIYIMLE